MGKVFIDGQDPTVDLLSLRATVNFGHFTSMHVSHGRVRGLDLHLERLRRASEELYGSSLDTDEVRSYLRSAVVGEQQAWARIDVFPGTTPGLTEHVMVTASKFLASPVDPITLKSAFYRRPIAHIKHVGGFAQIYLQKQARSQGYDDVLFIGDDGEISESSIANIAFIRGGQVVWPAADALHGVAWQLLDKIFETKGISSHRSTIRLDDVSSFDAAFTTNSRGIVPVARIDRMNISVNNRLVNDIQKWYSTEPEIEI